MNVGQGGVIDINPFFKILNGKKIYKWLELEIERKYFRNSVILRICHKVPYRVTQKMLGMLSLKMMTENKGGLTIDEGGGDERWNVLISVTF